MSHGKLREDKTCQNCGFIVEDRYCSHCGQENTETRQRFHFLITHFIEDFAHYDSSFWQTVKDLYFKPGFVTKEYLSGKRISYVNPVKLYIFISFISFLLLAIIPINPNGETNFDFSVGKDADTELALLDSLNKDAKLSNVNLLNENDKNAKVAELEKQLDNELTIFKPLVKKSIDIENSGLSKEKQREIFIEKIFSLLPKGLFVYMPIFAFVIWIFYNKKKWWYFDHGIYTLHYFSILLLSILFLSLLSRLVDWINLSFLNSLVSLITFIFSVYLVINFYRGAYVLYGEGKIITFIKGSLILFINSIILGIILAGITIYSFLHIV